VSDGNNDTAQIVVAITVMRQLQGQLNTLNTKIDAMESAHKARHRDLKESGQRNRWIGLIFGLVKTGFTFSGQISVLLASWFCAGYVWFAHQTYVKEISAWIMQHFSWLF